MGFKAFLEKLFGKSEGSGAGGGSGNGNGKNGTRMVCVDCRSEFLFEEGEQKFFKMRGLTPPKRCPNCRSKRKRRR